jgi:hypothetical protein
MTEELKQELRSIVNRQIRRIDASINLVEKQLGNVPTSVRSSINESSIALDSALETILEAIEFDAKQQNPSTSNEKINPLDAEGQEVLAASYSTDLTEEEFTPTLSIEELRARDTSAPSFAEALASAVNDESQAVVPPSLKTYEMPLSEPIAAHPQTEIEDAPQAEETAPTEIKEPEPEPVFTPPVLPDLTEEFEEEEQELSAFARMQQEVDKNFDEEEDDL